MNDKIDNRSVVINVLIAITGLSVGFGASQATLASIVSRHDAQLSSLKETVTQHLALMEKLTEQTTVVIAQNNAIMAQMKGIMK